jgi:hypothetical protein
MSGSKNARNAASITNRPTCGGSAKKSGLAPRVGWYLTSNVNLVGAPQTMPMTCKVNRTIQTQKYGYSATHGGNMG